jgi:hypothetical protein
VETEGKYVWENYPTGVGTEVVDSTHLGVAVCIAEGAECKQRGCINYETGSAKITHRVGCGLYPTGARYCILRVCGYCTQRVVGNLPTEVWDLYQPKFGYYTYGGLGIVPTGGWDCIHRGLGLYPPGFWDCSHQGSGMCPLGFGECTQQVMMTVASEVWGLYQSCGWVCAHRGRMYPSRGWTCTHRCGCELYSPEVTGIIL